jgi:hypothetical protein
MQLCPQFPLVDELILLGRRDVMLGIPYQRRAKEKASNQPTPLT